VNTAQSARGLTPTVSPARDLQSLQIRKRGNHVVGLGYTFCSAVGLGLLTSYTLGGFIHILLVLAVIVVVIRVIQGRRVT